MTDTDPTFSTVGEENIRGYLRRKNMQTVYYTSHESFCPDCKEIGGELFEAPLDIYCMAMECPTPEKQCEFVKHGGVRP
jgi:hypothetical protein